MEIVIGQQRSKRREQMGGRIESAMRSLIRREPVTKRFVIDAPGGNWLGITYTQNTHTQCIFGLLAIGGRRGKALIPRIYIYIYPVIQIVLLVSASLQLSRKRSKRERDGYP